MTTPHETQDLRQALNDAHARTQLSMDMEAKVYAENIKLREALQSCLDWMEFTIPRLGTTPTGSIERMNWGGPVHKARVALGLERPVSELSDAERANPFA